MNDTTRRDASTERMRNDSRFGAWTKTASAFLAGIVVCAIFNVATSTRDEVANAQAQDSSAIFGLDNANASPRVAFNDDGTATFSRPLEVPPIYAFESALNETDRQIVVVNSESKRICVYWIRKRDAYSSIELVAARNFELDLKLDNFNGEGLSPSQIREQVNAARR